MVREAQLRGVKPLAIKEEKKAAKRSSTADSTSSKSKKSRTKGNADTMQDNVDDEVLEAED